MRLGDFEIGVRPMFEPDVVLLHSPAYFGAPKVIVMTSAIKATARISSIFEIQPPKELGNEGKRAVLLRKAWEWRHQNALKCLVLGGHPLAGPKSDMEAQIHPYLQ